MKRPSIAPLKENRFHGTPDFPCAFYQVDSAFFPTGKPFLVEHHWHDELEIIYFKKGVFHLEINMEKYDIPAEAFCLVGSGDLHCIYSEELFQEAAFVFSLSMLCFADNDPVQSKIIQPLADRSLTLPRLITRQSPCFSAIKEEFLKIADMSGTDTKPPDYHKQYFIRTAEQYMRAKAALLSILAGLSENGLFVSPEVIADRRIETIKESLAYMQEHLTEKIYIQELAAQANMNEQYFCRFFKKVIGKPPIEYLNEMRIKYACRLLRETEHSVMDVCLESGFNNLGNFMRTFRRTCGCTPLQYRKSL